MSRARTIQGLVLIAWLVLVTLFFMPTVVGIFAIALVWGSVSICRRRVTR